jgi:diphthamide synthase (EF-2-diphthine--ammonia ligase)
MSWSGGKDCGFALYELQQASDHRVTTLLTSMSRESNRIGLHHVRRELVEQQAQALGIALHVVYIPTMAANIEYEAALAPALATLRVAGIEELVLLSQKIRGFALGEDVLASAIHSQRGELG